MKKIIYSFVLIFLISMFFSAKKISGCDASARLCQLKKINTADEQKTEIKTEPASLSLFYFNI